MTTQVQGVNCRLLMDSETTFKANPVVADAIYVPFTSESLQYNRNLITSMTIRSDRNPQQPVRGNAEIGGDINFELSPEYGRILRHTFGSETVASGSGLIRTHTYKIGSLPTGFVIEKQFPDLTTTSKYFQYNGCRVNTFTCRAKTEGMIECTINIMGAKETIGTSSIDASPRDLGHSPFDGFSASVKEGGIAVGTVTNFEFTIDNGLSGDSYVMDGTGERFDLPAGWAKVTGTMTCVFESVTLYQKALNNTETSLEIDFVKGTGTGSSAANASLKFYFDEVILKPQAPVISGPTGVVVELPFEAYYNDDADASAVYAVLCVPSYVF